MTDERYDQTIRTNNTKSLWPGPANVSLLFVSCVGMSQEGLRARVENLIDMVGQWRSSDPLLVRLLLGTHEVLQFHGDTTK